MLRLGLLLVIVLLSLAAPGAEAQTPITDPFAYPPAQGTTPACVTNLRASLVTGVPYIEWDHDYNLPMRAEQNADFVVFRAIANFEITVDGDGAIWRPSYPQFGEVARFDAETQEDYVDTAVLPGTTYRYFVAYDHGIEAERCNYVQIGLPGGLGTASARTDVLQTSGTGAIATLFVLVSVAGLNLLRRK